MAGCWLHGLQCEQLAAIDRIPLPECDTRGRIDSDHHSAKAMRGLRSTVVGTCPPLAQPDQSGFAHEAAEHFVEQGCWSAKEAHRDSMARLANPARWRKHHRPGPPQVEAVSQGAPVAPTGHSGIHERMSAGQNLPDFVPKWPQAREESDISNATKAYLVSRIRELAVENAVRGKVV